MINLSTDFTDYKPNIIVETQSQIATFTKALYLIESDSKIEPAEPIKPPNPNPHYWHYY